jgi:quercetin dioxygenase-like cupin family protein
MITGTTGPCLTPEVQLWSWTLGPGERYDAEPDPAGWQEMVVVTEGRLRVDRDQGPVTLAPGDYAVFSSTQAYAYVNAHHGVTRFIRNVVS